MLDCFAHILFRRVAPALALAAALALSAGAAVAADTGPATTPQNKQNNTGGQSGDDANSVLANLTNNAHVTRATLKNGLKIIVVPNRLAPAASTILTYDVGSRAAPKGFPGTAHAQEHMMFRGTDNLSASQISAISAAMGGRFNAQTQDEATQYYFTVPADLVDVALQLHAERMKSVLDTEADWKKERGAIEQEVSRDLSSPSYLAYKKLREQLFAGTPYAHDALGSKASFDKTTGKMLKAFHDQWYAPNNATLVVAGDVDPQQIVTEVRTLFGGIASKKLPKTPKIKLSPVKAKAIRMATDSSYGMAYVAFRAPGSNRPKQQAAAQVLSTILNNPRGQLYSKLVATGKSLGTGFGTDALRDSGIGYALAAFPKGADSKTLVKQVRAILADVAKKGVTADQVTTAKRQVLTGVAASRDSIPGLAMQWAQAVAIDRMDSPAAELKAINNVTAEDVNALARRMLRPAHSVLTVLTPEGSGAPSSGSGFGGGESFAPSHVDNVELPDWAAKPLADITTPEPNLEPQPMRLANGMKLLVVPAESADAVHVYGHIRNQADLQAPKKQEGVSSVLSRMLDFGTRKHGRVAYQAALDAIGAQASAGTDFSLTVLPGHFQRGLDLLAENELSPALPQRVFPIMKRQLAQQAAGTLASPDFHAGQAMRRGLYPQNDPSLRHATPESIQSLTYKEMTGYYQSVFRPDMTTLVVVGNVDPGHVKQAVQHSFGAWKNHGKKPAVDLPAVPPNKAAHTHVPDNSAVQDSVSLAETVGLRSGKHAYYALELGNQVLTGGFYASRLWRELRSERGLVYTINSGLNAGRTRTQLIFQYGSDPDKVSAASQAIRRALVQMAKAPVSDNELHQAQASLIRQVPLDEDSADAIAGGLLSRAELDLPLNEPYRAARAYQSIDAQVIQAAFEKWIRPNALVQVVQGPPPK